MHRAAYRLVAAKREAEVGQPARDMGAGTAAPDFARGLDEIERVAAMLFDASGDREDVRVENDVSGIGAVSDEEPVGSITDFDLALGGVGLADLVKRHDHDCSAVGAALAREFKKGAFALLHRNGVHDRLARHAFEAGLDHAPFGAVDHHRNSGNIGLGGDALQEHGHGLLGIEKGFVHVDVDDLRAIFDLVASDLDGRIIVAGEHQFLEAGGARDVAALADIYKARACARIIHSCHLHGSGCDQHRLEPGEQGAGTRSRGGARRAIAHRPGDGGDVQGSRPAAAADNVDESRFGPVADLGGRLFGRFVIFPKLIGKPGIRIGHHQRVGDCGQGGEMGPQLRCAERAIESDCDRTSMAHGRPEGLDRVAREVPSGKIGERHRDHQRQFAPKSLFGFERCHDCRLRVQRVEDRLHENEVDSALDESINLLAVDGLHLVEIDFAKSRVVDVRGKGKCLVRRPEGTGDPALPCRHGRQLRA